jgi:hypothetical protein
VDVDVPACHAPLASTSFTLAIETFRQNRIILTLMPTLQRFRNVRVRVDMAPLMGEAPCDEKTEVELEAADEVQCQYYGFAIHRLAHFSKLFSKSLDWLGEQETKEAPSKSSQFNHGERSFVFTITISLEMFSRSAVRCARPRRFPKCAQCRRQPLRRYSAASAQYVPQQSSPLSVFGSLMTELDKISPRFEIQASQIEILPGPVEFYATLKVCFTNHR